MSDFKVGDSVRIVNEQDRAVGKEAIVLRIETTPRQCAIVLPAGIAKVPHVYPLSELERIDAAEVDEPTPAAEAVSPGLSGPATDDGVDQPAAKHPESAPRVLDLETVAWLETQGEKLSLGLVRLTDLVQDNQRMMDEFLDMVCELAHQQPSLPGTVHRPQGGVL